MRATVILLCAFLSAASSPTVRGHAIVQLNARGHRDFSDPGHDKLGAVASESAVCSRIGVELIENGGNAADAVRHTYTRGIDLEAMLNSGWCSSLVRSSALGLLVSLVWT